MVTDEPVCVLFASEDGADGWEEELLSQAMRLGGDVLRLPRERSVSIPPEVAAGTLILSVTLAAKQVVNLVLFLADRLSTGIIIDSTSEGPIVKKSSDLRRGDILIVEDKTTKLLRANANGKLVERDVAQVLKKVTAKTVKNQK